MTQERINEIAQVLMEDKDNMKELLSLETPEAVARLNKSGFEISEEEMIEFGKVVKDILGNNNTISDELTETELENVAGGSIALGLFLVALALGWADYNLIKAFGW